MLASRGACKVPAPDYVRDIGEIYDADPPFEEKARALLAQAHALFERSHHEEVGRPRLLHEMGDRTRQGLAPVAAQRGFGGALEQGVRRPDGGRPSGPRGAPARRAPSRRPDRRGLEGRLGGAPSRLGCAALLLFDGKAQEFVAVAHDGAQQVGRDGGAVAGEMAGDISPPLPDVSLMRIATTLPILAALLIAWPAAAVGCPVVMPSANASARSVTG
jgi:hypothetical protein